MKKKKCHPNSKKLCTKVECETCRSRDFTNHPYSKHWDYEKNDGLPQEYLLTSCRLVYFLCDCGHSFMSCPYDISKNMRCPYCCVPVQKLCPKEANCASCFSKSYATIPYSKNLHPELNTVDPCTRGRCSNIKLWHLCPDCGHAFLSSPSSTIRGYGCLFCASKQLCDCKVCYTKSYASCDYSKNLHPTKNGDSKASNIFKFSNKYYWHTCPDCKKDFKAKPTDVAIHDRHCPCCHSFLMCPYEADCKVCYSKSYATCDYSKNLHPTKNGNTRASSYYKTSYKKLWHICPECKHDYHASPETIVAGCRCNCIRNKTENKVKNYFSTLKDIEFTHQPRFDWCRNPNTTIRLPFDFYFPEYKTIIEIDGLQHFQQVSNWGNLKDTQERDRLKEKLALENGVRIIRLLQWEIWEDKIDWKSEIEKALKAEFKPEIVYLAKNIQVYSSSESLSNDED